MTSDSPYVFVQRMDKSGFFKKMKPVLSSLDMELTERCNNNCVHCCINLPACDAAARRKELSTDQIKEILEEAVSLGCLRVRFTGGEALLRPDFEELYIFARKRGMKVLVFTNATLITSSLADLFERIPPLIEMEITVYGMHRGSYEAVSRVPGSYDAAWRGIRLLTEHKIPFIVKGALLPQNKSETGEFEDWASNNVPRLQGRKPSYSMFFDLRCRRDDPEKNRLIRSVRMSPAEGVAFLSREKESYIKEMQEFCAKFMRSSGDRLFSCGAGCGGCVDAYGFFQPCMMVRHPDLVYDLRQGSLKEALKVFSTKIRDMKAENPEYLRRCGRCFLKGLCEQCPAKSWMEYGTLDTPVEYCCEVAHAQARYLGLIGEKENAWEVRDPKKRVDRFVHPIKTEEVTT